jgi:hypothetical protein
MALLTFSIFTLVNAYIRWRGADYLLKWWTCQNQSMLRDGKLRDTVGNGYGHSICGGSNADAGLDGQGRDFLFIRALVGELWTMRNSISELKDKISTLEAIQPGTSPTPTEPKETLGPYEHNLDHSTSYKFKCPSHKCYKQFTSIDDSMWLKPDKTNQDVFERYEAKNKAESR